MDLRLLRKGFRHLLGGNFEIIWESAVERTRRQIPDIIDYATEEGAPAWLQSSETVRVYRLDDDYLFELDEFDLSIQYEDGIESVELPLIEIDRSDCVRIERKDGGSSTSAGRCDIKIDGSYDYPPIIWRRFDGPSAGNRVNFRVNVEPEETILNSLSRVAAKIKPGKNKISDAKVGSPAIVPTREYPPIVLVSIDTLRYDQKAELTPLIDELGPEAVIPCEPRTQGHWTPPSHASMFTGTHPGVHGYVGWDIGEETEWPINPGLTTIPELLTDCGYKCSGLVSHNQIIPEFGFGRGFHRFRCDGMAYSDWVTRASDAKASVHQLIDWIDEDLETRDHSLFYFLHVFDPHYPYIPPIRSINGGVDFSKSKEYMNQIRTAQGSDWTYLDGCHNNYQIDPSLVQEMKTWYSKSVEYTASQVAHLLQHLKSSEIFDQSLIIITGDHGEEFGERGFFTHNSIYDDNIRPFMAIKPPSTETWNIRDEVNTIDFLPTIATLVDEEVPVHCSGTAIQDDNNECARITERIYPDWYNVAVESDGVKGIFTYKSNFPDRPQEVEVKDGHVLAEYYNISDVRSGFYAETNVAHKKKEALLAIAERFISTNPIRHSRDVEAIRPAQKTNKQLRDLGYK